VAVPGQRVSGNRVLIAGIVAFVLVLAAWAIYAAAHSAGWTLYPVDLGVYRDGGLIVRHVSPPYDANLTHPLYDWSNGKTLQFTYPPFAALAFAAVSFVPAFLDGRLEQAVNLVALVMTGWLTMRALGYTDRRVRIGGALLGATAGLLAEPVYRTVYLGQVNLILMALIIWDLTQPDTAASRHWKGIATGIAAGVKLTPLVFIPYLLLTRKFRQAALACAGFAGTVALGFIVVPGDSTAWWLHGLFAKDGRTGFVGWGGNQSLRAIATRLAGSIDAGTVGWIVAVAIVTVCGLLAAAMLYRAGHSVLGLLMAALVGLLDSPVSWDHHWVWVVPGMMAAGHYAVRAWHGGLRRRALGCAAVAIGTLLLYAPWPGGLWSVKTSGPGNFTWGLIWAAPNSKVTYFVQHGDKPWFLEYHWSGPQLFAGNAFVLGGLILFAILVFTALISGGAAKRRAGAGASEDYPAIA
jgi:alpha-1,2-mannosyltransferase